MKNDNVPTKTTHEQVYELFKDTIFSRGDYHHLSWNETDFLHIYAKKTGYRKPKDANGSLGRYYFNYLSRKFNNQ
jgi:hypothetical protein